MRSMLQNCFLMRHWYSKVFTVYYKFILIHVFPFYRKNATTVLNDNRFIKENRENENNLVGLFFIPLLIMLSILILVGIYLYRERKKRKGNVFLLCKGIFSLSLSLEISVMPLTSNFIYAYHVDVSLTRYFVSNISLSFSLFLCLA